MYGLTNLNTGVTPPRLANLISYSWARHEFPGAFAEFGVFTGGSLDLLAKVNPHRKIYGIDGFKGLPKPSQYDTHQKGEFKISKLYYSEMVDYFSLHHPNVEIIKGYSPEVFEMLPVDVRFSFVHCDTDLYESVAHALDYFMPRLYDGGIIIFDDYGFDTTPGAKIAIDEWNGKCQYRGELKMAHNFFCGQYIIVK